MGYLIQVSDDKMTKLSENIESGLRCIGKAMQCVEEMCEGEGMMGQREREWENDTTKWHDGMYGERRWGNQYGSGRVGRRMGYRMPDYHDPVLY